MAKTREKFDFTAFHAAVRKRQFAPVYFFYGEERFLVDECVDAIVRYGVDPAMKEFNFDLIQGSESDAKRIVAAAAAYPMMADRRVVVVKEFERTVRKESEDVYAAYIENPSPSTVLVLIGSSADFRRKPYTTLKARAVTAECRPLYENDAMAWIEARVKGLGRRIEPAAVAMLHSCVGTSLQELANELEKVFIAVGDRPNITAADIDRVVGVSREFSSFELSNMTGEKNAARAMEIGARMLRSGESAVAVIAALTLHFVKLYKLQDGIRQRKSESELAAIAGVHPFFLKSLTAHARRYTPAEIENAFLVLAEADLSVKSSVDPSVALTKALTEIIGGVRPEASVL